MAVQGVGKDTRGTAFVVYEDIYDAKMAVEHLSGFNVANRYLIVLYYNPARQTKKVHLNLRFWTLIGLICDHPALFYLCMYKYGIRGYICLGFVFFVRNAVLSIAGGHDAILNYYPRSKT